MSDEEKNEQHEEAAVTDDAPVADEATVDSGESTEADAPPAESADAPAAADAYCPWLSDGPEPAAWSRVERLPDVEGEPRHRRPRRLIPALDSPHERVAERWEDDDCRQPRDNSRRSGHARDPR